MKLLEKIENLFKKVDKKLFSNEYDSPLNPFLLYHYTNLKEEELDGAKEGVLSKIDENNEVIKHLKKEIYDKRVCEAYKEYAKELKEDLEYQNTTAKEIVRVIDLRKQKILDKKSKKTKVKLSKKIKNFS